MSEYVQFAGAMILFVGLLTGSYWFAVAAPGRSERAGFSRDGRA